MEIIWFTSGLYGFIGSILLVVFHLLPQLKGVFNKKLRRFSFFSGENEKEISLAINNYSFYSKLWSFRLISTSFLIIILYSISVFEYSVSIGNILYVLGDCLFLFIAASLGVEGASKNGVTLKIPQFAPLFYILPFGAFFPIIFFIFGDGIIDYIFLVASAISQWLFIGIWYLKFHSNLKFGILN
jgi:hypothetical protein